VEPVVHGCSSNGRDQAERDSLTGEEPVASCAIGLKGAVRGTDRTGPVGADGHALFLHSHTRVHEDKVSREWWEIASRAFRQGRN
jgi:hypothetical protein